MQSSQRVREVQNQALALPVQSTTLVCNSAQEHLQGVNHVL